MNRTKVNGQYASGRVDAPVLFVEGLACALNSNEVLTRARTTHKMPQGSIATMFPVDNHGNVLILKGRGGSECEHLDGCSSWWLRWPRFYFKTRRRAAKSRTADSSASLSLTGLVTSTEEGAMEGVLVSAKREGSTISLTVVSDQQGRYRFPAGRLTAGHYSVTIRAGGYDLDSPTSVDIPVGKGATADIKLRKTSNQASQLTNADWLSSFPGTPEQKASVQGCTHCHTLERIVRSRHDADEFLGVLDRMSRNTRRNRFL